MASLENDSSDKYLIEEKIWKILKASQPNSIKDQDLADRFEMPCEKMNLHLMQLEFSDLIRRISDSPSSWAIRPASNDDSLETDAEPSASDSGPQQATSLPSEETSEKEILASRQPSSLPFLDEDQTLPKQRCQPEAFSDSITPSSEKPPETILKQLDETYYASGATAGIPPETIPKQLDETYYASGATADTTDGARACPRTFQADGRGVRNSSNLDLQDYIDTFTKIINMLVMNPDWIKALDIAKHVCGVNAGKSAVNKELHQLEKMNMASQMGTGKQIKWKFIGSRRPTDEWIKCTAIEFAKTHKPKRDERKKSTANEITNNTISNGGGGTCNNISNCRTVVAGNNNTFFFTYQGANEQRDAADKTADEGEQTETKERDGEKKDEEKKDRERRS